MQIDESRKLLLSDTLVPDIFITEYLPDLSGLAVKLYIYMLLAARSRQKISEQELARRLGTDDDTIRTALLELATRDLVEIQDRGIMIADIKAMEIERTYRPKTASTPTEAIASQEKFNVREKLMTDIAKTFFQGLMSPSWYGEIDSWFDRYHFEPEVIYALFQECARRNKLDSKAYISKVAENWAKRGITSFEQLNTYFLSHERLSKASKKVGRKLRRRMTEYDEEMVARWLDKFGFEFEIIELALRKTTRLSNPNLNAVDRILQEWFSHQLKDAESIKAYEEQKAQKHAALRSNSTSGSGSGAKARNIGNFKQREYSDDYLSEFYEDVPVENQEESKPQEPPAEQVWPDQLDFSDLTQGGAPSAAASDAKHS